MLQYKIKFLNKVWIVGMQEENQHSLQRKQRAGVRRKETGREENYGHCFSFVKILFSSFQFSHSVVSDSCDPMNCSMPGLLVHQYLLELT